MMRRFRLLAALLALALMVVSCGGDSSDDTSGAGDDSGSTDASGDAGGEDSSDGDSSADDSDTDSSDEVTLYSESDFASVCRETGVSAASPYTNGDGGPSRLVVLEGEDPEYGYSTVSLPDEWETSYGELEITQLVLCVDRVAATPVELCEGYKDEESGLEWSIQTHDTDYEVTLRQAVTAEVVATESFTAPADGCPMFSIYSEGDPTPVLDHETPDAEIEVFVRPFVTGS